MASKRLRLCADDAMLRHGAVVLAPAHRSARKTSIASYSKSSAGRRAQVSSCCVGLAGLVSPTGPMLVLMLTIHVVCIVQEDLDMLNDLELKVQKLSQVHVFLVLTSETESLLHGLLVRHCSLSVLVG